MDVLTLSSKGQVVIPASIRKTLSIDVGDKLAAFVSDDVIMLKVLRMPSTDEFRAKLDEAQVWASSVGYVEQDVDDIIKEVRTLHNSP